jgi:O-antigen ligase
LLWIVIGPYFGQAGLHISLGRGIPDLSLSRIILALLVGILMAQIATGRRRMAPITRTDFWVMLSLFGVGSSIATAVLKSASLAWFFESFLMPVAVYFIARNLIVDERKLAGAQRALIAVGVTMALVVLQEQLMGYTWFPAPGSTGSTSYGRHLRRATALLGNPAFIGVTLAMVLPFAWRAMVEQPRPSMRRLMLVFIGLMYVGLFVTYNRASWAGGVAGLLVMFLFYPRVRKSVLFLAPLIAVPVVVYWAQITSSYAISERLVAVNPINYRVETYTMAWSFIQRNPLLGIGFGNMWLISGLGTPHNSFLWMLLSAGVAGFVPYLGGFVFMGWDSLQLYIKAPRVAGLDRGLLAAFWASLAAYGAQLMALDMLYGIYPNIVFYFIAGAVLGYQEAAAAQARGRPAPGLVEL